MRSLISPSRLARPALGLAGALIGSALAAAPAPAAWPGAGTQLGTELYGFYAARVYPAADGGATIAFFSRFGGTQTYPLLRLARVTADGILLSSDGPYDLTDADLCPTGDGGIYIAQAYFGPTTVQRVPPTPGWPPFGVTLVPAGSSPKVSPKCVLTSDAGCLVAWSSNLELYASAVRSDATVDPGWGPTGLDLGPAYLDDDENVVADDAGGATLVWWRYLSSVGSIVPVLARVTGNGSLAPGWPAGGLLLRQDLPFNLLQAPGLLRLAGGDVLVMWKTGTGTFAPGQFYLQRVRPDGTLAPGWPAGGRVVLDTSDSVGIPQLVSDGGDGAFLVWAAQLPAGGSEVRAMHVLGDGSIGAGWPSGGLRVSAPAAVYNASTSPEGGFSGSPMVYNFRSCPDGSGGLFVAWQDGRGSAGASVWLTHWTGGGIPGTGWTVDGRQASDPAFGRGVLAGIAPAPAGSVFVAWSGDSQVIPHFYYTSWLSKIDPEIPTPVLASLVSAAVVDGRVQLEWWQGGSSAAVTVYRSAAGGPWNAVATLAPNGSGRVAYEDAAVEPGARYGYRLGVTEGGVETVAGEVWVEVPRLSLTLEGARPNPSPGGALAASFTLAGGGPARLEVLDLAGRRVTGAEVGSLGPGRHVVTLAPPGALPPGLYLLRLRQDGRQVEKRAAVLP